MIELGDKMNILVFENELQNLKRLNDDNEEILLSIQEFSNQNSGIDSLLNDYYNNTYIKTKNKINEATSRINESLNLNCSGLNELYSLMISEKNKLVGIDGKSIAEVPFQKCKSMV